MEEPNKEVSMSDDSFKDSALRYHSDPVPGKLAIRPTKPLANNRDLSVPILQVWHLPVKKLPVIPGRQQT